MAILVREAKAADLDAVAPLFDAYRVFYEQPADLELAHRFLSERLARSESIILLAEAASGEATGFSQLYPSFSSSRAAPILILNDLFVAPAWRGAGVGRALLSAAAELGRARGAVGLTLATARTNHAAQALYRRAGWVLDETFLTFDLPLD